MMLFAWGWDKHLKTERVSVCPAVVLLLFLEAPSLCLRHPLCLFLFPALVLCLSFLTTGLLFLALCYISIPFVALYPFLFVFLLCQSGAALLRNGDGSQAGRGGNNVGFILKKTEFLKMERRWNQDTRADCRDFCTPMFTAALLTITRR